MVLQTKKIERDWILLTYDISIQNNNQRDKFRDDLIWEMGALYQNDSVYLLPKKIHSIQEIKRFAKQYGVNIVLFGLDADLESCKTISKRYVKVLRDRRKDVKQTIKEALDRLEVVSRNKDESLTGFHNKIKEVEMLFNHYDELCEKYGNKQDEWNVDGLSRDVDRVKSKYEKTKLAKKI